MHIQHLATSSYALNWEVFPSSAVCPRIGLPQLIIRVISSLRVLHCAFRLFFKKFCAVVRPELGIPSNIGTQKLQQISYARACVCWASKFAINMPSPKAAAFMFLEMHTEKQSATDTARLTSPCPHSTWGSSGHACSETRCAQRSNCAPIHGYCAWDLTTSLQMRMQTCTEKLHKVGYHAIGTHARKKWEYRFQ